MYHSHIKTRQNACPCSLNGEHCSTASSTRETEVYMEEEHDREDVGMVEPPPQIGPDRIWAVLVGIDAYAQYPLRGCVADALAMERYLVDHLLVPRERIQRLLGPAGDISTDVSSIPSRAKVISNLHSLITNPDIKRGDPIIIFFSRHATRYPLSDDDDNDPGFDSELDEECSPEYVEVLCPMDRNTIDNSGAFIPDITDRELNTLLAQIARTKGNRITFILDCCHAGSVTRTPNSGVRTVPPLEHASVKDMLLAAEKTLKDLPGYQSIVAKDWGPDMESHVVVAACREDEVANETRTKQRGEAWAGVFTTALVKVLQLGKLKEEATYIDLIETLGRRICHQTPNVTGGRKNTRLWYQH
ncbi:caspase domain-containing protein [Armillaria novae-zelandiae]|uniref:Caspase domain-containing protein n=1 Tax=Armillaria novae-zelandiae TaxID=153914 RepID=A0AA39TET7_9AGAR|nr:caspase domain-containing protein [Armillaria novae-zelandiae]